MSPEESEAQERPVEDRERQSRRLLELLNELRVALTGVQILFAFLLTVPFTQRFTHVTEFQRYVYFVTLLSAAAAVALLIAPSAHHRVLFRRHQKRELVLLGSTFMIVGLGCLALSMTGVVMLITDVLFRTGTVIVVSSAVAVMFVVLWYVIPLMRLVQLSRSEPTGRGNTGSLFPSGPAGSFSPWKGSSWRRSWRRGARWSRSGGWLESTLRPSGTG